MGIERRGYPQSIMADLETFSIVGLGVVGKIKVGFYAPTDAGLEFTLPKNRLHYTLRREDMQTAREIRDKAVSEDRLVSVSFVDKLDSGELLDNTPTLSADSGIMASNPIVNSETLTINGRQALAGQAVQFQVEGGTAGEAYEVDILCNTDSTPAQTMGGTITVNVVAD